MPAEPTPTTVASGGVLHLIPVGLGEAPINDWLPHEAQALAGQLNTYIAENAKTARAFLKLTPLTHPLQDITIHELTPRVDDATLQGWLTPLRSGGSIGLVSEAGCPAVADPGARAVAIAHQWGITVKPWVGPSSILLGLMASGLDGQRFAFHGYAPVDAGERTKQLKAWELFSSKQHQTQILIETPYRNAAMIEAMLQSLQGNTQMCVAADLSLPNALVISKTVSAWQAQIKKEPGLLQALHQRPAVFLILA